MKNVELGMGLGRLMAVDPRDANYRIEPLLKQAPATEAAERGYRYWYAEGWNGNQGETPQCVAYGWLHWLHDGPISQPGAKPMFTPEKLYKEAQKIDEWPGENYQGTSVRAGAKILHKLGLIGSYYWTWDVMVLAKTVLNLGPVVVGTDWSADMQKPQKRSGLIQFSGQLLGGHCYKIDGVNMDYELFRMKNSWGKKWGLNGHAFITFKDMQRLLAAGGECCIATEVKSGPDLLIPSTLK